MRGCSAWRSIFTRPRRPPDPGARRHAARAPHPGRPGQRGHRRHRARQPQEKPLRPRGKGGTPPTRRPSRGRLEPLVAAVADGSLRVAVARTLPLTAAEEAHHLSRSGRMTGKLILLP
ncbi:zinc-binding dehydrogenase [Kitasatospora sp. NPDC047058]|uniref:zinc-binding dehydrogenase n=1 Tax=Kitasatospora sp. NPDC047058 TaxID=3155620 RepID=UPI0033C8DC8E